MFDLGALLGSLREASVRFIVVGGAAAVLHRAPVTTVDLDIVHDRDPENVDRLLAVLQQLDARVRDPAGRVIRPAASHLVGPGQSLLTTTLGDLDCLGTLHDGRGYAELEPHTERIQDGNDDLLVLDLATLIEVKTKAGRPKDRIVVPVLLELLRREEE
ncbi:MAG: hypothetical protein H6718_06560 [Polyangiaceae bacterium]|nr:hypothetical protein [Polyangiaceae bacterium]MCB9610068.1 hypothetical protein [Polyangiaceae bacterium]